MCGRFALKTSYSELKRFFGVTNEASPAATATTSAPRFNISPTQDILGVRQSAEEDGGREALFLKWGLVPSWAKDVSIGAKLINARSETVEEKPSFREAFSRRRLLIPSDAFYEWERCANGRKQPYLFRMKDEQPFALAGLWERWKGVDGKILETCTILTTQANALLAKIHERMPVVIRRDDFDLWLGNDMRHQGLRRELLRPYPAEEMTSHPVSTLINNPSQEGPNLAEHLAKAPINSL